MVVIAIVSFLNGILKTKIDIDIYLSGKNVHDNDEDGEDENYCA